MLNIKCIYFITERLLKSILTQVMVLKMILLDIISFFYFVSEGHLIVAQLILDSGALVNVPSGSENNIPLTLACWKGQCFIFKKINNYLNMPPILF